MKDRHFESLQAMAIIDINEYRKNLNKEVKPKVNIDSKAFYSRFETLKKQAERPGVKEKVASRVFFAFLLILNFFWLVSALFMWVVSYLLMVISFFSSLGVKKIYTKFSLNLRRSAVCFLALFIAIFNPSLGIMFCCLYFMMYDKMGIEEIVPSSLREQFKEFFN